ncbi:MAG: hypothetical protein PVF22_02920 [Candidatus Aminicenantes bacterium]
MRRKFDLRAFLALSALVVGFLILAGCAVKKGNIWGDPDTGLILTYRMPEGEVLKYQTSSETNQSLDVMGQIVDVEIDGTSLFSVQAKGLKEDNLRLLITIESMSMDVFSSEGELSPDMSTVEEKSFEMILSPLGKELELIGVDAIKYDMGPEGEHSIESEFQGFFPNFSESAVKVGDTWTSQDVITDVSDTGEMRIILDNTHTLDGFETVEGLECVRIKSSIKGTMEGEGTQGGMDLVYQGKVEGTDTLYFAYKKGVFIKGIMNGTVEGTIFVESQNLDIPFTREMKMQSELKK